MLEHIPDNEAAIKGLFSLLEENGHLLLSFPYNENKYIENVYKLEGSSYGQDANYICQSYSRDQVDKWVKNNNAKIVEQKYYQVFTGDYWTVGEKLSVPIEVSKNEKHHLTCLVLKKL